MSDTALLALLQLCDTAFPSGAFAFSGGLEALVGEGRVQGAAQVGDFLTDEVLPRWAGFDRVFLRRAHATRDLEEIARIDADCELHSTVESLASASRRTGRAALSTHTRLGTPGCAALLAQVRAGQTPGHAAVVQGLAGNGLGLALAPLEAGTLHALALATLSAAVRLGALGAMQAQQILAAARPAMAALLAAPPPAAPFTFSPRADIAAMRHGQTPLRLFAV